MINKLRALYDSAPADLRRRIVILASVLIFANVFIWVVTLISSTKYPLLLGLITLAYGFGLRHAVDADHIAAIDNTTRKLMRDGKRPVAVGLFFSLGHSLVVILLSVFAAFSAAYVGAHLPAYKAAGSIVGTTVSCLFLLVLGLINLSALLSTVRLWRGIRNGRQSLSHTELDAHLDNHGALARLLRPLLRVVTESWNMLYIGFLFGLGFDTASEIGLLSLSAASGGAGMPIWNVLLLPLAFTAGMTLIDSFNSILMLGAYGWAYLKPVRKLYYNMTITAISVITALFIGGIEGLQLFSDRFDITGGVFTLIDNFNLGSFGYIIIAVFAVSLLVSVSIYKVKGYDLLDA